MHVTSILFTMHVLTFEYGIMGCHAFLPKYHNQLGRLAKDKANLSYAAPAPSFGHPSSRCNRTLSGSDVALRQRSGIS